MWGIRSDLAVGGICSKTSNYSQFGYISEIFDAKFLRLIKGDIKPWLKTPY